MSLSHVRRLSVHRICILSIHLMHPGTFFAIRRIQSHACISPRSHVLMSLRPHSRPPNTSSPLLCQRPRSSSGYRTWRAGPLASLLILHNVGSSILRPDISLTTSPFTLHPSPYSLLPAPCSLLLAPCSMPHALFSLDPILFHLVRTNCSRLRVKYSQPPGTWP